MTQDLVTSAAQGNRPYSLNSCRKHLAFGDPHAMNFFLSGSLSCPVILSFLLNYLSWVVRLSAEWISNVFAVLR